MNSENIKQVTNQAINQLLEALNAGHSEALTRYLSAIAKFRTYSLCNVLLILKQCPNAGRVAGYRAWQSLGRQVKKGEKGIMILAPVLRKRTDVASEPDTADESRAVATYRVVRKNSIPLPSDRNAGTYLFGFPSLGNPKNRFCEQKILLGQTDPVPS